MKTKNVLLRTLLLVLTVPVLIACQPDYSKHIEVLNDIDASTQYSLYEKLDDMDNSKPIKSGDLGIEFVQCLENYSNEWNPGEAKEKYYLEINGYKSKHYYTLRANERKIESISRWEEKFEYGFRDGKPLLKVSCSLNDLKG